LKKVLYISYDGLTDPLGQSQILPYLKGLTKHGFEFTILSFEKKARYEKEKDIVNSIITEAGIRWVPLSFTAKPPVLAKIYDRFRIWEKAKSLHQKEQFDLVHCRSYVAAEVGLKMKRKFGIKMLFDMRGFWADEKVDNGQWDLKKPFYRYLYRHYKKKEDRFLMESDAIISLTQSAKNYLLQKEAYKDLEIEVIPCCADLKHFDYHRIDQNKVAQLRTELQIPRDAKVVTYLGSVGGWYMVNEMFRFLKLLQSKHPEYVMLFLTKDNTNDVKRKATVAGVDPSKIFVTYSNRDKLPYYLGLSNFSLFFIRNTFSKMASSPTKHAELMGMGIPVICNDIGDTGNIIKETKTGLLVKDLDESGLIDAVNSITELEGIDKNHIRQSAKELFDLATGVKKYLKGYQNSLLKA
jgi:glycosyltransferase involved in cell wall biosynthesis